MKKKLGDHFVWEFFGNSSPFLPAAPLDAREGSHFFPAMDEMVTNFIHKG